MKIKFLGAAGTVTGSGYLVTSNSGQSILVDLGLFQGPEQIEALNYQAIDLDVTKLAGVVLTHAHLDHCGRLPILKKIGYTGNIFMTAPTAELAELTLLDTAKISAEDNPEKALYSKTDVLEFIPTFQIKNYNQKFQIADFQINLLDAGHIIGSASVEITVDGKTLVLSGDLGNTPEDLTFPTQEPKSADVVIMESTYGDRLHPKGEASDIIQSEINIIESNSGTLLIPAFALERTQELLHIISHLKSKNLISPSTKVYLDSPMAEKATLIYEKYKSFLNEEVKNDFRNSDPFSFPGLFVVKNRRDSAVIRNEPGPKVIIAGSGMMTGGRIVDHAKNLLLLGNTRLLIVGYQAIGTLGRSLLDSQSDVEINGEKIHVNAQITDTQVMSSHADQSQLIQWFKSISGVTHLILTHGEDGPRHQLAQTINSTVPNLTNSFPVLNQEIEII